MNIGWEDLGSMAPKGCDVVSCRLIDAARSSRKEGGKALARYRVVPGLLACTLPSQNASAKAFSRSSAIRSTPAWPMKSKPSSRAMNSFLRRSRCGTDFVCFLTILTNPV
eukprot:scaffold89468_cov33-Tisochrysis_lutea.AAC.2